MVTQSFLGWTPLQPLHRLYRSLSSSISLSIYISPGAREQRKGVKCHSSGSEAQEKRGERNRDRGRKEERRRKEAGEREEKDRGKEERDRGEDVYLAFLVTLLWPLSGSHELDFLKLLQHHWPSETRHSHRQSTTE